jgi:hypothetical protein
VLVRSHFYKVFTGGIGADLIQGCWARLSGDWLFSAFVRFMAASFRSRSACSRRADRSAKRMASISESCTVRACAHSSRIRSSRRR